MGQAGDDERGGGGMLGQSELNESELNESRPADQQYTEIFQVGGSTVDLCLADGRVSSRPVFQVGGLG